MFTKNQRQWTAPPLSEQTIAAFKQAWHRWGYYPIISHDSYLTNLASPDASVREKSIQAFAQEIIRCSLLDITLLVTHPGAYKEQTLEQGIRTYVQSLDQALDKAGAQDPESSKVKVLLETTAGQGTCLGATFQELAAIMDSSNYPERLGICLDTCHMFAAGYDLSTRDAFQNSLQQLDRILGIDRVHAIHLNDCKSGWGSRKDRHEHIGQGELGLDAFRLILNEPGFLRIPMIIETPKDKAGKWDRENLLALSNLISSVNSGQAE